MSGWPEEPYKQDAYQPDNLIRRTKVRRSLKERGRLGRKAATIKNRMYKACIFCWICGRPIFNKITFDHIIPRSKGGTDELSNIKLAHHDCNQRRRSDDAKVIVDWMYVYGLDGKRQMRIRDLRRLQVGDQFVACWVNDSPTDISVDVEIVSVSYIDSKDVLANGYRFGHYTARDDKGGNNYVKTDIGTAFLFYP